ncbi:hypothetical protein B0J11DRAFT_513094, partial [Dendryphion nanum]
YTIITPDSSKNSPAAPEVSNSDSYLKSRVRVDVITQRAMIELYSVRVVTKPWTRVQEAISGLSEQLERWSVSLPIGLNFTQQNSDASFQRERLILEMHYLGTKILITRPCLCRLDTRLTNQLKTSSDFDRQTAWACICAAKAMANLLPDQYDPRYLYRTGPWWCIVHNLMQALVILLLEIASKCIPFSHGEEILSSMKKLIRWLRAMKSNNEIAKRGYDMADSILQRLVPQVDVDITDLLTEHAAELEKSAASNYGAHFTNGYKHRYLFSAGNRNQQSEEQKSHADIFYNDQTGCKSMFAFPPGSTCSSSLLAGFNSADRVSRGHLPGDGIFFSNPFATPYDGQLQAAPTIMDMSRYLTSSLPNLKAMRLFLGWRSLRLHTKE